MTAAKQFCREIYTFLETRRPLGIVWFSASLVVLYTLLAVVISPVFFRDSSEYAAAVDAFGWGDYTRAFPLHLPVLFTLFAGLLTKIFTLPGATALLIVSGLAAALTIFPLYGLLKRVLPGRWAAWGTLLFVLLPDAMKCSIAPLIDSGRFLFMTLSLYLVFHDRNPIKLRTLVFLGLTYGCLILVRAEGILLVGLAIFIHMLRILHTANWSMPHKLVGVWAAVLPLCIASVLCLPRLYQMHQRTGYAAIDLRQSNAVASAWNLLKGDDKPFVTVIKKPVVPEQSGTSRPVQLRPNKVSPGRATGPKAPPLPASYENSGGANQITFDWRLLLKQDRLYHNLLESFHWLYAPFTGLGLLILILRRRCGFNLKMLLLTMVLYDLEHIILRAAAGRYFIMNAVFVMPLTLIGMRAIQLKAWKYLKDNAVFLVLPVIVTAVLCSVYTMRHFGTHKHECFQTLKTYFAQVTPMNRDTDRPVVLLIGADWGLGYYSQVNIIGYTKYGLNKTCAISDMIRKGVSGKYATYWGGRHVPAHTMIDAVVLDNRKHADALAGCEDLFEPPYHAGHLTVYKVKTP